VKSATARAWFLNLFAECVCQPREPAHVHVHPHVQVPALGKRRADAILVGIARAINLASANALCRAVFAFGAVRRCAVHFHKHGLVNVVTERHIEGDGFVFTRQTREPERWQADEERIFNLFQSFKHRR
jgi:hypothetical protein